MNRRFNIPTSRGNRKSGGGNGKNVTGNGNSNKNRYLKFSNDCAWFSSLLPPLSRKLHFNLDRDNIITYTHEKKTHIKEREINLPYSLYTQKQNRYTVTSSKIHTNLRILLGIFCNDIGLKTVTKSVTSRNRCLEVAHV